MIIIQNDKTTASAVKTLVVSRIEMRFPVRQAHGLYINAGFDKGNKVIKEEVV